MFKIILIALTAVSMSGCVYQSVNNIDIKKAIKYCGGPDYIEYINSHWMGDEVLKCTNRDKKVLIENVLLEDQK